MKLLNTALVPECDSNLIFFGQLFELGIMFHNSSGNITLTRDAKIIAQAKQHQNLFILNQVILEMAMGVKNFAMTIRRGRLIYLVSKNKKIRIWHKCLGYASNAYIVKT